MAAKEGFSLVASCEDELSELARTSSSALLNFKALMATLKYQSCDSFLSLSGELDDCLPESY
jgi:hypothetical protein